MAGLLDLIQARRRNEAAAREGAVAGGALDLQTPDGVDLSPSQGTDPHAYEGPSTADVAGRGFIPRLSEAGVEDVSGALNNAMGATAQALGFDNYAERKRHEAQINQDRSEKITGDQIKDVYDVNSFGSVAKYVGGQIIRGAPMIAAAGVGAGLGAITGVGALAGAGAASFALNAGDIYGGIHEKITEMRKAGQIDAAKEAELRDRSLADTAMGGLVSAALDTGSMGFIFKAKPFVKGALASAMAPSLKGHVARSILAEGGTEALQQYVQIVAQKHALEQPDQFGLTPDDVKEIVNAGAAGASMALPMGPVGYTSAGINRGVNAGIDAVGGAINAFRGPEEPPPGAPVDPNAPTPPPGPNVGARLGKRLASLIDDPAQLKEASANAFESLKAIPGVEAIYNNSRDLLGALNQSQNVTRVMHRLDESKDVIQAGFQQFKASFKSNLNVNTNLAEAPTRYKQMFAHFIGAQGYDSASLARMSGEKVAEFINAFNDALPSIESNTGSVFNTAAGIAKQAAGGAADFAKNAAGAAAANFDASVLKDKMPDGQTDIRAKMGQAGETFGEFAGQAGTAASNMAAKGIDKAGAIAAGSARAAQEFFKNMSRTADEAEMQAAADSLFAAFGATADGTKKSLHGRMSPEEKALYTTFKELKSAEGKPVSDYVARHMAKVFNVVADNSQDFDRLMNDPELGAERRRALADLTDLQPFEFKALVYRALSQRVPDYGNEAKPDRLQQRGELYSNPGLTSSSEQSDAMFEQQQANADEAPDTTAADNQVDPDTGIQESANPEKGRKRDERMTADVFRKSLATPAQAAGDPEKVGSNRWFLVHRTEYNDQDGVVSNSSEPFYVNMMNLARYAGEKRDVALRDQARGGERDQAKFLHNATDGIAALVNGWTEHNPDNGNRVDITVEPARIGADGQARPAPELNTGSRTIVTTRKGQAFSLGDLAKRNRMNDVAEIARGVERYRRDMRSFRKENPWEEKDSSVMTPDGRKQYEGQRAEYLAALDAAKQKAAGGVLATAREDWDEFMRLVREDNPENMQYVISATHKFLSPEGQSTPVLDSTWKRLHTQSYPGGKAGAAWVIRNGLVKASHQGNPELLYFDIQPTPAELSKIREQLESMEDPENPNVGKNDPEYVKLSRQYGEGVLAAIYRELQNSFDDGVAPAVALLPTEVREAVRGELQAMVTNTELAAHRANLGEHATSTDAVDFNDSKNDAFGDERGAQPRNDLAGDKIQPGFNTTETLQNHAKGQAQAARQGGVRPGRYVKPLAQAPSGASLTTPPGANQLGSILDIAKQAVADETPPAAGAPTQGELFQQPVYHGSGPESPLSQQARILGVDYTSTIGPSEGIRGGRHKALAEAQRRGAPRAGAAPLSAQDVMFPESMRGKPESMPVSPPEGFDLAEANPLGKQGTLDVTQGQGPAAPAPDLGPRGKARENLARLYSKKGGTKAFKNLVEHAMNSLVSDNRLTTAQLEKLADPKLTADTLKGYHRMAGDKPSRKRRNEILREEQLIAFWKRKREARARRGEPPIDNPDGITQEELDSYQEYIDRNPAETPDVEESTAGLKSARQKDLDRQPAAAPTVNQPGAAKATAELEAALGREEAQRAYQSDVEDVGGAPVKKGAKQGKAPKDLTTQLEDIFRTAGSKNPGNVAEPTLTKSQNTILQHKGTVDTPEGRYTKHPDGVHFTPRAPKSPKAEPAAAPAQKKPGVDDLSSKLSLSKGTKTETLIDTTDPRVQAVLIAAMEKITGNKIKAGFNAMQGHQGEYQTATKMIWLAATKDFSASNAFHEAFHAVWENFLTADQRRTLYRGLTTPAVKRQVKLLLENSPGAWEAANKSADEMMAYAFQFWHNGFLQVGPDTSTIAGKLIALWDKAVAWLKDQPNAAQMLEQIRTGAFANGGPSPAEIALAKEKRVLNGARDVLAYAARGLDKLWDQMGVPFDDRIRQFGNPHAEWLAKQMYTQVGERSKTRGLIHVIPSEVKKRLNKIAMIQQRNRAGFYETLEQMASGKDADATNQTIAKEIRAVLDETHAYLRAAGVDINYLPDYIPLSWDGDKIAANKTAFIEMLTNHQQEIDELNADLKKDAGKGKTYEKLDAEAIWELMSKRNLATNEFGGSAYDRNGVPNMDAVHDRVFSFLTNEDRRPFVRDDLNQGLTRYIKQAVKRAEWVRRMGAQNEQWNDRLAKAKEFGLNKEEIQLLEDYKDALFGVKLYNMSKTLRKATQIATVYQNYRVLSTALLGSVVDPMGIAVRSGDWADATAAFGTAIGRIFKKGRLKTADIESLGEMIGAIETAGVADSLSELYGGVDLEGMAHKANDYLFTINGMNGLTRSTRIAALAAGLKFIARHAKNSGQGTSLQVQGTKSGISVKESTRHMAELGLSPGDVTYDAEGKIIVDDKVAAALNRFVDEAVLRPNVGERTAWGADPTLALLYHLKQYIFSFNKVINKKAEHEFIEHGNVTPYLMAMTYIPIMAGSSMIRDLLYNGGTIPAQNGFMHYLSAGYSRSGLGGPSLLAEQLAMGAATGDIFPFKQALGPTVDQGMDALAAIVQPEKFGKFVLESLPGGNVAQHASTILHGAAAAPVPK